MDTLTNLVLISTDSLPTKAISGKCVLLALFLLREGILFVKGDAILLDSPSLLSDQRRSLRLPLLLVRAHRLGTVPVFDNLGSESEETSSSTSTVVKPFPPNLALLYSGLICMVHFTVASMIVPPIELDIFQKRK